MKPEKRHLNIFNLKDLERELRINKRTLREYCRDGKLKAKKIGRTYLVTEQALWDFLGR